MSIIGSSKNVNYFTGVWHHSKIICNTKGELLCENCNTQHYFNVSTRLICGLSIGAPMFILQSLFHYGYYILLVYILWLALVIYLTPFFARVHIKAGFDSKII
jgi:CXXC-20-CXXC protein